MYFIGTKQIIIDFVKNQFIILIKGSITSVVTASFVESFGGNFLKKYSLPYKLWKFKFSISMFVIVTCYLEYHFFR